MDTQQSGSMMSSARGMARLNGSNRAAWNAMDLQIGAHAPPAKSRGGGTQDNASLSARNVLLRKKLRERKRYDSADDAMKKAAGRYQSQPQTRPQTQPQTDTQTQIPAARLGQSAFFNAMESQTPQSGAAQARNVLIQRKLQSKSSFDSADYQMALARRNNEAAEDVTMEDVSDDGPQQAASSPCASSAAVADRRQQYASMSPSRMGKYGSLENKAKPSRREMLEKKQTPGGGGGGSKYGKLSAANILIRRQLKERKRFDSADYAMEKQGQPTDVPADVAASPAAPGTACAPLGSAQAAINHQVKHIKLSEDPSGRVATPAPNAAQAVMAARAARYAGLKSTASPAKGNQAAVDRYGIDKSAVPQGAAAACNVVVQRKLNERKVFDSADHFKKAA